MKYFHTIGCVSVQLIISLLVFFSCSLTDVVYIYEYCRMAVAFILPRLQFSIIPLLKTLGNQHFNYTAYYFSCVMYIPIRLLEKMSPLTNATFSKVSLLPIYLFI